MLKNLFNVPRNYNQITSHSNLIVNPGQNFVVLFLKLRNYLSFFIDWSALSKKALCFESLWDFSKIKNHKLQCQGNTWFSCWLKLKIKLRNFKVLFSFLLFLYDFILTLSILMLTYIFLSWLTLPCLFYFGQNCK